MSRPAERIESVAASVEHIDLGAVADVLGRQNDINSHAAALRLREYQDGKHDSLDDAFGQRRGPGKRKPSARVMLRERNALYLIDLRWRMRPSVARIWNQFVERRSGHLVSRPFGGFLRQFSI